MITVGQLIDALSKVKNKNRIVLMSSDPEGNSFRALYEVEVDNIAGREDGYEFEIGPERAAEGIDEDCVLEDGKPAIVLWP